MFQKIDTLKCHLSYNKHEFVTKVCHMFYNANFTNVTILQMENLKRNSNYKRT